MLPSPARHLTAQGIARFVPQSDSSILDAVVAQFRARYGEPEIQKQAYRWAIQLAPFHPTINLWVELGQDGSGAVVWIFDPKDESQPAVNIRISRLNEVERAVERVRAQFERVLGQQQSPTDL